MASKLLKLLIISSLELFLSALLHRKCGRRRNSELDLKCPSIINLQCSYSSQGYFRGFHVQESIEVIGFSKFNKFSFA